MDVREDELRALLWSFLYFFFLLSAYYVLRPIRDEMGVAGGVRNLPWLFTATFLVMLAAVPFFGWVVARLPRRRFVPLVYRFFILNILIFFALMSLDIDTVLVGRAFFIWVSVFNLFVISVFWSVMADLFRNEQGRRLFGFIAAGGSLGALLGPAITASLATTLGPVNLLLISAVLLEGAVRCLRGAAGAAPARDPSVPDPAPPIGGGLLAGLGHVARSPYLLGIAGYILLLTTTATALYLQQAEIVRAASDDAGTRTQIFAGIDLSVSLLTILIQLFVTGRLMRRFGVGAALAVLPVVVILGFALLAAGALGGVSMVVLIVIIQTVRRASNFAISKPAREVLYTVLAREDKYKAKNVIDTLVYRGGDAASAWVFDGLGKLGLAFAAIAGIGAALAAGWLLLSVALGRAQNDRAALADGEPVSAIAEGGER